MSRSGAIAGLAYSIACYRNICSLIFFIENGDDRVGCGVAFERENGGR